MAKLKILTSKVPSLRQKSVKIRQITPEITGFILDLAQTMKEDQGVGIAAPQVGNNIRLCMISTEKGPLALINPIIFWKSIRKEIEEEGCLSCPDVFGLVKRSKIIYVRAIDAEGKRLQFRAEGFFARVIQHEVDHLDGILIVDKIIKS